MQRSLLIFENSIKSPVTFKKYIYYLDVFLKFYHIKDFDSLASISLEKAQIMIEDYVMDLKKRVNPNSVPTYVQPIQTFFDVNDVELKWKKIHRLFPAKIKSTGKKAYTNHEIQKMLDHATTLRNKVIIHFLASTGCRIGALPDLKIRNLKRMDNDSHAVLIYEDSIEEYWTFLTPEASSVFDEYLQIRKQNGERLDGNSPVFRTDYQLGIEKVTPMTKKVLIDQNAQQLFYDLDPL